MPVFEWTDRFELGIPEIDAQHMKWFVLTNRFLTLAEKGQAEAPKVREALAAAVEYSQTHFKAEEALMRDIGFPQSDYDWHVMTHNAFLERINALAKRCREGHANVAAEMSVFMCGWLRRHILAADKKYLGFYVSKSGAGITAQRRRRYQSVRRRKPGSGE